MTDTFHHHAHLGPYRLIQELAPGASSAMGARWLALHEQEQTSHTLHHLPLSGDKGDKRRVVSALSALSALTHPHLLRIERFTLEGDHAAWIVTPYTGVAGGSLLTLPEHLAAKGGRMSPAEALRATTHILQAMAAAHGAGIVHGPIDRERLLVDRFGSIRIELYGLDRLLHSTHASLSHSERAELIRDEVRGIVELAYRLITGLEPDEPLIPPAKLVKRLDRHLGDWLDLGLDPSAGYATPEQALTALTSPTPRPVVSPVRQVLDRFRARPAATQR